MIKHLRIDNRLIHGQVTVTWQGAIGADSIVVCNDEVAVDSIQKKLLPMAARGTKVHVLTIDETFSYSQENQDESLFVICKFPSDALALLEKGAEVATVNVGNAAPIQGTNFTMVTKSVAVTDVDAKVYRKIAEFFDGKLYSQITSTGEKQNFIKLLDKVGL